jgi:N-formylglutamate amidohydrolase
VPAPFTVHRPDPAVAVPVVIHVPHASTFIPDHCRTDFALGGDDLQAVVDAMVDRGTDQVALQALAWGAHVFVNNVCRLVVDPERFAPDADEKAARWGMGAVYTRTHDGRPLRRADWAAADRAARMAGFYHPYHEAMRGLVEELLERFAGPVRILDLHSYPHAPHPYETDREVRPAFCLGHEAGRAPAPWLRWWEDEADAYLAAGAGLGREQLIAHNRPFAGSFVPQGLGAGADRVQSMMLEINRGLTVCGSGSPARGQAPGEGASAAAPPPEVRAFGTAGRVRRFLEFVCRDAWGGGAPRGALQAQDTIQ